MKMYPVESSQVQEIGHDPATNTLAVRFKSGGLYHYADVTAEQFSGLQKAKSVGAHLNAHIKGRHEFKKVS